MKKLAFNFVAFCWLLLAYSACSAMPEPSTGELSQRFQQLAVSAMQIQTSNLSTVTTAKSRELADMQAVADEIMTRNDYSTYMLSLIDERKGSDDQARQKLIRAIVNSTREYTANDILFLRSVFVASMSFQYNRLYSR